MHEANGALLDILVDNSVIIPYTIFLKLDEHFVEQWSLVYIYGALGKIQFISHLFKI